MGLTQRELAETLSLSHNAISQYESSINSNNHRIPDAVMIKTIATFFDVSIDDLINKDLEANNQMVSVNISRIKQYIKVLFPTITTDLAMHNKQFAKGYYYYNETIKTFFDDKYILKNWNEYYEKFKKLNAKKRNHLHQIYKIVFEDNDPTLLNNLLDKAYNYFSRVSENELQPEVSANKLGILFLKYNLLCSNTDIITDIEENGTIEFTSNTYNDITYPSDLKKHNSFVEEYLVEILEYIKILKSTNDYHELGDYYLSLFFMNRLLPYEKNNEEFRWIEKHLNIIGTGMFFAFYLIDNKYILQLYNAIDNLFNTE